LLGGEGTRLRPLTYSMPKQMLPVAGVPMIKRVLFKLSQFGIGEVVLSLGYKPDYFINALKGEELYGIRLSYVVEPTLLDTAGAIKFAIDKADISNTFIALNADVLTDIDISKIVKLHQNKEALATIALTPVEDPSRYGVAELTDDNRITAFIEKPTKKEAPSNYINAGCYVLEPECFDFESGKRVSIEKEIFPKLVVQHKMYGLKCNEYWIDTGTPEAFIRASLDYLYDKRGPLVIDGETVLEPYQRVLGCPKIEGKLSGACLILDGCVINGQITDAVIEQNCKLESGSTIQNSYIFSNCTIGPECYIYNSIIGKDSIIEKGAKITNSLIGFSQKIESGTVLENQKIPA
jgi:mannose-1-phosphate guanylyltransferase